MDESFFRKNPEYRDNLKKFLETDCGKAMLSIISQRSIPKSLPSPQPGVPLDTLFAHQLNRCIEAGRVVADILRLSDPLTEKEVRQDEDAEFFHGLPDKMKDQIRKMRENQP